MQQAQNQVLSAVAKNQVLEILEGNKFFKQFDILVPHYSKGGYFLKMTQI